MTLIEEIARAIYEYDGVSEHEVHHWGNLSQVCGRDIYAAKAKAALAVITRHLREPTKEMCLVVHDMRHDTSIRTGAILRALADHLEGEK